MKIIVGKITTGDITLQTETTLLIYLTLIFSFSSDTVSPDTKRTTSYSKFSSEGRVDVLQAKKHLESARRDFKTIGAYSREKDVMYLMVSMACFVHFCLFLHSSLLLRIR